MLPMELILLGLLQESPKSTYELQHELAARRLSQWVKFSIPGLYRTVIQLTAKGYLSKNTPDEEEEEEAIYALTKAGRDYFEQLMMAWARQDVSFYLECNVVTAHLDHLETEKALEVLAALRESILSSAQARKIQSAEEGELSLPEQALFEQQELLYQALLRWLDGVEARVKTGKTDS